MAIWFVEQPQNKMMAQLVVTGLQLGGAEVAPGDLGSDREPSCRAGTTGLDRRCHSELRHICSGKDATGGL